MLIDDDVDDEVQQPTRDSPTVMT